MSISLDDYIGLVRAAAESSDGRPVYNGSLAHAEVITNALFHSAKSRIDILCGSLNPRVYGSSDAIENLREFLGFHEAKIRVLLEKPEDVDRRDNPFVNAFCKHPDVELWELPEEIRNRVGHHFIVVDDKSYRYEPDKSKHEAVAAFGDIEGAKNLALIFNSLLSKSAKAHY